MGRTVNTGGKELRHRGAILPTVKHKLLSALLVGPFSLPGPGGFSAPGIIVGRSDAAWFTRG